MDLEYLISGLGYVALDVGLLLVGMALTAFTVSSLVGSWLPGL